MVTEFKFAIKRTNLDEHYQPLENTRITTNFANLARGEKRQENLKKALMMINNRFNAMAHWDNHEGNRYAVRLEIISVELELFEQGLTFPVIEMLQTCIVDTHAKKTIEGIVGNNFSSYVRDYDFSVLLKQYNQNRTGFNIPDDFGVLHGKMFQQLICSETYQNHFSKRPVMCLSVSDQKTYRRLDNRHPILGVEYCPHESSLTEQYFQKMGLQVRYFMPPNSVAPLSFYFCGDLLNDYSHLELIGTISTMETFQKIYRPELYNANAVAGAYYKPNLKNSDYSVTQIVYDREERSRLAIEQGQFAAKNLIEPYRHVFEALLTDCQA